MELRLTFAFNITRCDVSAVEGLFTFINNNNNKNMTMFETADWLILLLSSSQVRFFFHYVYVRQISTIVECMIENDLITPSFP